MSKKSVIKILKEPKAKQKKKKFYITTAIDYVNAAPHLGHAYEKILADVAARWHRLKNEDVFFLTGTDENAQKNAQAAKQAGIPTKEFIDKNAEKFKELCKVLNISYDDFIRTTEARHIKVSQLIFKKIYDKGDIYKKYYEGYYCSGCEEFKTERDLVQGKCPEHNSKPEWLKEESYFFRLSKYKDELKKIIKNGLILPETRKHEILSRLNNELRDLSVSRINVDWGIDTPIDKKHKIYVWIDALVNYISALDYPEGKNFRKYWPADVHLIGKGINWFHSVIWPALLLSAGIELPRKIVVHGYVNTMGQKLSKTLGNVVDPFELVKKYGTDQLRYYLLREIPFGEDGDFSEQALKERINNELASDLGNLISRVLTLAENAQKQGIKFQGKPELEKTFNLKSIEEHYDSFEFHLVIKEIWNFIGTCNKYINDKQPWKLQGKELENVLYNLLESLRITSILISPILPETAEEISKQIGTKLGKVKDGKFKEFNGKIKKGKHLFEKLK